MRANAAEQRGSRRGMEAERRGGGERSPRASAQERCPPLDKRGYGRLPAGATGIEVQGFDGRKDFGAGGKGFTVLELLVVIGIIGLLVSIGLPALKGIGQTNLTAAVNRQVLDDLAYARMRAIADRTTVYIVFVPPTNIFQRMTLGGMTVSEMKRLTNLIEGQFTGYAILSDRTVGDQPGQKHPRYLSSWRRLPGGMLFTPYQFDPKRINSPDPKQRAFAQALFPFPTATSLPMQLPYIGFNAEGQLLSQRNEEISIARGSIFYPRDPRDRSGKLYAMQPPDVVLTPPGPDNREYFDITWVTGRAAVESKSFPNPK